MAKEFGQASGTARDFITSKGTLIGKEKRKTKRKEIETLGRREEVHPC